MISKGYVRNHKKNLDSKNGERNDADSQLPKKMRSARNSHQLVELP